MEFLTVILLAVGLMALAMVAMAISILIKKGGRFPNTHVSGNKFLRSEGIYCAQTQDKVEQKKGWAKVNFKKMSLSPNVKMDK